MTPILVLLRLCVEIIARVFLHLRIWRSARLRAMGFHRRSSSRANRRADSSQRTSLSSFRAFWELRERQAFQVFSFHEISFDLGAAKFASCRTSGESLHPKPNDAWRDRRSGRR